MWQLSVPLIMAAMIVSGVPQETMAKQESTKKGLKVYISVDLEGIAGVVTPSQLGPAGFEYNKFREITTAEVLAAIHGARQAGATEFVISDSHGNGENLLIDQLPTDVTLIRAWPRPLGMMAGIDSTFDAAMLIGYHASAHSMGGVRAHTLSSARLTGIRLNDEYASETALSAAIAGHFGVPIVLVTGDDVTLKEARETLGDVEGAVVKEALGFHSAATMMPEAAQALIRERARAALERLADFQPYVLDTPIQLDVSFKNYRAAELLEYLPIVHRTAARTIRFTGRDMREVSGFLTFINNYAPDIEP